MRSLYPQETVEAVLERLEALDVLEYIDFHPESIQRERNGTIRCYCPIHRDERFRSLEVNEGARTYRCNDAACDGSEGGDLVGLTALSLGLDYDHALRRLLEEFQVDVLLPEDAEDLQRLLDEAESFLAKVESDPSSAQEPRERVVALLDEALGRQRSNRRALMLLARLHRGTGNAAGRSDAIARLAGAMRDSGASEEAEALLREHLGEDPLDVRLLGALADLLAAQDRAEEAAEQLMMLADACEVAGDYTAALDAYRRLQALGDVGMDVEPMIMQLLLASGREDEAANDLLARAASLEEEGRDEEASEALLEYLAIRPAGAEAVQRLATVELRSGRHEEDPARLLGAIDGLIEAKAFAAADGVLQQVEAARGEDAALLQRRIALARARMDHPAVMAALGKWMNFLRACGDTQAALDVIENEILKVSPDNRRAIRVAAELSRDLGDTEGTLARFRKLEQLYERDGMHERAAAAALEVVNLAPREPSHWMRLVQLLVLAGKTTEAVTVTREGCSALKGSAAPEELLDLAMFGLDMDPAQADLLLVVAQALRDTGRAADARPRLAKACELLIAEGRLAEAEQHARALLKEGPDDAAASILLAGILKRQGRPDESAAILRLLAQRFYQQGEFLECANILERIIDLQPDDRQALDLLAEVAAALKDAPRLSKARHALARHLVRRGALDEALSECEAILSSAPGDLAAHRLRIEVQAARGDMEAWERASLAHVAALEEAGVEEGAIQELAALLERRPQCVEARAGLLRRALDAGDQEAAEDQVGALVEVAERHALHDEGVALLERILEGRDPAPACAQDALKRLREIATQADAETREGLRLLHQHEDAGDRAGIMQVLAELADRNPGRGDWRRRLIAMLREDGRDADAANQCVREAAELLERGDHRRATAVLEEAVRVDRDCRDALRTLMELAEEAGALEEAAQHRRALAFSTARGGAKDRAIALLREGLASDPRDLEHIRAMADVHLEEPARDTARAIEHLQELAARHEEAEQEDEAAACRREIVELLGGTREARLDLVEHLLRRGRRADAAAGLEEMAGVARAAGNPRQALDDVDRALAIEPRRLSARSLRAELLQETGDSAAALEEWRTLSPLLRAEGDPGDPGLAILPEYDFDRFIVSENNRFAWATAQAVAKAPGRTPHNPLFIHSDVGLGKTHILQAIANHVRAQQPGARIVYTNAEEFTTELVDAIQRNAVAAFRQRYRSCDMLLLDDVHLLAGKQRAQEEFFSIFNTLYQARRQIVVTSDRPPRDIALLEQRLRSRFGAGVIVDIQSPSVEVRLAVLRSLAKERGISAPDDALSVLAEAFDENIRELKGAFNQWVLVGEVGGAPLDAASARAVVGKLAAAGR